MGHWISLTRPGIDVIGSEPIGVRYLVRWVIDHDARFVSSGPGIRAGVRIDAALKEAEGEDHLFIEQDNDLALVRDAVENPVGVRGQPLGYPCSQPRKLLPYIDDIAQATDKKPKPKKLVAAS